MLAVNHHYYREVMPTNGIYPINRTWLLTEVESLRTKRRPLGQKELLEAVADPEKVHGLADSFVLTFDDGLKEQMAALRDLQQTGVAALFFVPTAPLAEGRVLDVHKLHLIRATRTDAELFLDLHGHFPLALRRLDVAAAARQYRYDDDAALRVKYLLYFVLEPDERRDWIDRVFATVVGTESDVVAKLYMDREDIRTLAGQNMLGTHAHSHRPLAQMAGDEMAQDIASSMDILAEMGGQAINGISFPYGGPNAVSDMVVEACAGLGLSFGFTMQRGCNEAEDFLVPLRLKRIDCNDVKSHL